LRSVQGRSQLTALQPTGACDTADSVDTWCSRARSRTGVSALSAVSTADTIPIRGGVPIRHCSVCTLPRRREAEDLQQQGRSIRHCAAAIDVGVAALHRHWQRHVINRDSVLPVSPSCHEARQTSRSRPRCHQPTQRGGDIWRAGSRSAGARNAWDVGAIT